MMHATLSAVPSLTGTPRDVSTVETALPRVHDAEESLRQDHSDVFVCRRDDSPSTLPAAPPSLVTLYVYGWHNVEPGQLSWVFPSLRSALDAVRTMRNAVQWCVVAGEEWPSIDAARAQGAVLVEQLG
ncbi:hypothetical protein AKJ09_00850 [Labilithrix luteola]|uniref:Uncharacterized protein n=1 Tax=Labilithrix luteola TaxID=1391654 RepID=A0A0K1PLA4_9BACT|nr:hypothetical protein [Labilithrix luteola]AKU94186.1 hypothetical protein AKJ09_00850 [Labilithrix luteola]